MPEESEATTSLPESEVQSAGAGPSDAATTDGSPVTPEEPAADAGQVTESLDGDASATGDEVPDELSDAELAELKANETTYQWEASEYVHHHKSSAWYLGLFGALAVLIAVLFWLHYWLEIGLFLMMGIAIVVYGAKAPRSLVYELSPTGITIDGKFYAFNLFRAFGVLADEEWHQIDLEPVKRFAPRLSILFDSANADEIVGHLSLHLVRSDRQPDPIERLARYLRF